MAGAAVQAGLRSGTHGVAHRGARVDGSPTTCHCVLDTPVRSTGGLPRPGLHSMSRNGRVGCASGRARCSTWNNVVIHNLDRGQTALRLGRHAVVGYSGSDSPSPIAIRRGTARSTRHQLDPWHGRRTQTKRLGLVVASGSSCTREVRCGDRSLRVRDLPALFHVKQRPRSSIRGACSSEPASSDRPTRLAASATPRPMWTSDGAIVGKPAGRPGVSSCVSRQGRCARSCGWWSPASTGPRA